MPPRENKKPGDDGRRSFCRLLAKGTEDENKADAYYTALKNRATTMQNLGGITKKEAAAITKIVDAIQGQENSHGRLLKTLRERYCSGVST